MGAEQSSGSGAVVLRSQRDEDLPYTSYSISKPIDGDTPKASPRLTTKSRSPVGRDTGGRRSPAGGGKAGTSGMSRHDTLIVVKEAVRETEPDPELLKLEQSPLIPPIMKAGFNVPHFHVGEPLDKLDSVAVLQLCARYQEHLKQCAEAVSFDQNALCVRIKEVDFTLQSLYSQLTERQKRYGKYAEQCNKINEMHSALNKIHMNIEQTTALMSRLNSVLPLEHQLEPFSSSVRERKAATTSTS